MNGAHRLRRPAIGATKDQRVRFGAELHSALEALGVGPGGEFLVMPLSRPAPDPSPPEAEPADQSLT